MKKTRLFRMVPEMGDMLDEIRKTHKLRNNVEASRFLCSTRKKGSILDMLPLFVVFFMFTIGIILGLYLLNSYETTAGSYLPTTGDHIIDKGQDTLSYMDEAGVFVLFGLIIAILVGCYYLRTHPILLGVTMLVLVFVIFVSGVMSDTFTQLTATGALSASEFPITKMLWENMPVITLIAGVLIMIVIYAFSSDNKGGMQ